jgi:hypothetical protein
MREPLATRVGRLPSILPDAPRDPRADSLAHDARRTAHDARCDARSGGRRAPCPREPSTRRSMHCTQWATRRSSTVAEHRGLVIRAHVPANAPGRIEGRRERRDRTVACGEVPRCPKRPWHSGHDDHRGAASTTTTVACAHATRAAGSAPSRRRQTRHAPHRLLHRMREPLATRVGRLPSILPDAPRDPRADSLAHDARRTAHDARCDARSGGRRAPCPREQSTRRSMHCTQWATRRSSTVAEHRGLVIRAHVPANAPGRIEGRRERRDRTVACGEVPRCPKRRPCGARREAADAVADVASAQDPEEWTPWRRSRLCTTARSPCPRSPHR